MAIRIKLADLTKLVDGEISLREYVAGSENTVDDRVLEGAAVALGTLQANKHLLNMVLDWINAPVTFAGTPNPTGAMVADQATPDELSPRIEGLSDLKAVLVDCCPECEDTVCEDD